MCPFHFIVFGCILRPLLPFSSSFGCSVCLGFTSSDGNEKEEEQEGALTMKWRIPTHLFTPAHTHAHTYTHTHMHSSPFPPFFTSSSVSLMA